MAGPSVITFRSFEALVELLYATGGVKDALLARVERVRGAGDFDINDGVSVTVFPLNRLFTLCG